jgi:hypothetical protein
MATQKATDIAYIRQKEQDFLNANPHIRQQQQQLEQQMMQQQQQIPQVQQQLNKMQQIQIMQQQQQLQAQQREQQIQNIKRLQQMQKMQEINGGNVNANLTPSQQQLLQQQQNLQQVQNNGVNRGPQLTPIQQQQLLKQNGQQFQMNRPNKPLNFLQKQRQNEMNTLYSKQPVGPFSNPKGGILGTPLNTQPGRLFEKVEQSENTTDDSSTMDDSDLSSRISRQSTVDSTQVDSATRAIIRKTGRGQRKAKLKITTSHNGSNDE